MVNTPVVDVEKILDALEAFINQRPGLDPANYGLHPEQLRYSSASQREDARRAYRAEIREIGKQRKRALKLLAQVRRSTTQDLALLLDSFRAYSGRLSWDGEKLTYTTGQYFPTEYRNAAAAVLETYERALARKWNDEHPQAFTYRTLADVKAANKASGGCWFDRSTMRFFGTRIETGLLSRGSGRQFFITSEQGDPTWARKYSIREALPDGSVDTVGEFQAYRTLEDARLALRLIA